MKKRITIWSFTGILFAAVMVGVLGFSSVGSTNPKASAASAKSATLQSSRADSSTYKADRDANSDQYQTAIVFWPIRSAAR